MGSISIIFSPPNTNFFAYSVTGYIVKPEIVKGQSYLFYIVKLVEGSAAAVNAKFASQPFRPLAHIVGQQTQPEAGG